MTDKILCYECMYFKKLIYERNIQKFYSPKIIIIRLEKLKKVRNYRIILHINMSYNRPNQSPF